MIGFLQSVAEKSGLELVPDPAGAACYGPKISVQARDALVRTWQMSTGQLERHYPVLGDFKGLAFPQQHRPI